MLTHNQIWNAIDRLAARAKLTPRDVQWIPVGAGAGARGGAVRARMRRVRSRERGR